MLEDNKALVRRYVEEFQSGGNLAALEELVAANIVHHGGPGWSTANVVGREGAHGVIAMLRDAFPDLHAVIHEKLAENDRVMTRKTFYGTHRGEFRGVAPTGRQVAIDVIDIVRIADGQMTEHWNVIDWTGVLQQLG